MEKRKCRHFDEIFITGCSVLTTFSAASDENFYKMKTFPFQCTYFKRKVLTKYGQMSAAGFVFSGDMVLAPTCTWRHVLMHLPHKTLLFKHFKIARFGPTNTDVSWKNCHQPLGAYSVRWDAQFQNRLRICVVRRAFILIINWFQCPLLLTWFNFNPSMDK